MEILKYIIPPLVGAVIGYFTNYIAVKMLFRPLYPVKIGGKTLPFTPGIIPKGKPRLAKALGKAVGTTLLTEDDIKNVLVSDSMKDTIRNFAENLLKSELTVKDFAGKAMSEEKYEEIKSNICRIITDKIVNAAESANLGKIIAEKGGETVKEKISGTMFSMFIKDDFINSLCKSLGDKVNEYINKNLEDLVSPVVESEAEKLENKTIYQLLSETGTDVDKITNSIVDIYVKFIENNAETFIKNFRIAEIVEEKVNQMDVIMLEELLMSIMKKELNAVVNLGAIIGLILGTINIFF